MVGLEKHRDLEGWKAGRRKVEGGRWKAGRIWKRCGLSATPEKKKIKEANTKAHNGAAADGGKLPRLFKSVLVFDDTIIQ